ncbi:MAG: hypothetical protein ABIT96_08625 [Ferruginibacter sp.]
MKKFLAVAIVAMSLVACNENKTEETKVDSIDSTMENKMDSVENRSDSVVNVMDSVKDAKIDSVKATN